MNPSVEQILRENYVDGVFHTHVSMLQPRGKFQFNREKLEDFWDVYCNKILEDENAIVDWVLNMASAGFPITNKELLDSIQYSLNRANG